jgi:DNA polymerase II large subunit
MSASPQPSKIGPADRFLAETQNTPLSQYLLGLTNSYRSSLLMARSAKATGLDITRTISSQEVCDMADRLTVITGLSKLEERARELLRNNSVETAAFKLSEDLAVGRFGFLDKEGILNNAMAISLALVTSCVTMVPSEDITRVLIKKNGDGSSYPAITFGNILGVLTPLQAAFTLLVLDRVRVIIGLDKYRVNSVGDDEVARFIEEARLAQRTNGSQLFQANDADIEMALRNLPVEIDGTPTEAEEVVVNRGLKRVETDRIRGGALYVLIEGIIRRADRLLDLSKAYQLEEWSWLEGLSRSREKKEKEEETAYILNAKPGKPVLSLPRMPGAFRLRYGRAPNTGMGCYGVHPAILELLDYPITTGTQIKVSILHRTGTVNTVDSIEAPFVRLRNGSAKYIETVEEAKRLKDQVEEVLRMGDLLVSVGDFMATNSKLEASGYTEDWWALDILDRISQRHMSLEELATATKIEYGKLETILFRPFSTSPTLEQAASISYLLGVPLHPRHSYYWDLLSVKDIILLRNAVLEYHELADSLPLLTMANDIRTKKALEAAAIPHEVNKTSIYIKGEHAKATKLTLNPGKEIPVTAAYSDTLSLLSFLSGITFRRKSSAYVGVAMRRIEVAAPRKLKPSTHVIFPVGRKATPTHDVFQAGKTPDSVELYLRECLACGSRSPYNTCPFCENSTNQIYYCTHCNKERSTDKCPECKSPTEKFTTILPKVQDLLRAACANIALQPYPPLKGVVKLLNRNRQPERLEKGILRQRHNLMTFKDGTVRYDVTNCPLTHFKPSQLHVSIETLRDLGYQSDENGLPLESEEQILELKPQDIIIPQDAVDHFKRLADYIDDLLVRFFKTNAFYNIKDSNDLLGALAVGISPRSSLGVVGRIVGFTSARACFAHPVWHAAKFRDCSGDVDSITLLMDVLLNFSSELCPNQAGGTLDTPFMLIPLVSPSGISSRIEYFEIADKYPLRFYVQTNESSDSRTLTAIVPTYGSRTATTKDPCSGFKYTQPTSTLTASQSRSIYASPITIPDKVTKQIAIAARIAAVNADRVVTSLLDNYLAKEIMADLQAYAIQPFKCKGCGERYRRPPIKGVCLTCGRELVPTVVLSTVEKYAFLANELSKAYRIAPATRDRVTLTLDNLQLLSEAKKQTALSDYM